MFLGFDTETTGLPNKYKLPTDDCQPDIVQLCAKLFDMERVYQSINLIVVSDKEIHPKALEAHGISTELSQKVGVSRRVMVGMFNNMAKLAHTIVCHNVNFDIPRMQAAYFREGLPFDHIRIKPKFCTMLEATHICGITNEKGLKWPSLQEAYKILVDPEGFKGAHDAENDVNAMIPIFRCLKNGHRTQTDAA